MDPVTLAKNQIRADRWRMLIQTCQQSGQTVISWCEENNVNIKSYYYWLRKVKTAALQQAGFVELPLPEAKPVPTSDFAAQMVIKLGGAELGINNDTPTELITRILEVIRHAE